jgi:hypothetical protein
MLHEFKISCTPKSTFINFRRTDRRTQFQQLFNNFLRRNTNVPIVLPKKFYNTKKLIENYHSQVGSAQIPCNSNGHNGLSIWRRLVNAGWSMCSNGNEGKSLKFELNLNFQQALTCTP